MVINTSDFAQLVTEFRQKRGMSQGQLAQATRLSRTYIYHLEAGMRSNPSPHVAQSIARVLELSNEERRRFYEAYTRLTGQQIDDPLADSVLLDFGELAQLLVRNTSYPAHSLDRLWFLHSWNEAATNLFELPEFRRIASASYPEGRPAPSFVFHVHHSILGLLALRTATTVFTGINTYSMVSYVPGDQQTLEIYRKCQWQPE